MPSQRPDLHTPRGSILPPNKTQQHSFNTVNEDEDLPNQLSGQERSHPNRSSISTVVVTELEPPLNLTQSCTKASQR